VATATKTGADGVAAAAAEDLTLTKIAGKPSAELAAAIAYGRAKGAKRWDFLVAYLTELWRLATKMGYDPAVLAAQSAEETAVWTSDGWVQKGNPAGMGADDDKPFDQWLGWETGEEAARAHIVHMSAYLGGYVAKLRPYIRLDRKWQAVFEAGYVFRVSTLRDLSKRWASDPFYAEKIADHLRAIRRQIVTPGPTPGTNPPAGIVYLGTGNWHERHPSAATVFVVSHITDDLVLEDTISWFQNPLSQASAHFTIDRDGKVYQFVSTSKAAWTNGDVQVPRNDIPLLTDWLGRAFPWPSPHTVNDCCVTCEFVGKPEVPPTEEQYRAALPLYAYVRDRFAIRPSRAHFLRHGDINSVSRAYCPGPDFMLGRIISELGGDPEDLAA
jgi:N-acetyl-anhydromuramyl-L-alanine amidase AmpD